MRMLLFFTIAFVFISCRPAKPKINEESAIKTIKEYLLKDGKKDSTVKEIDSINIMNVDYLTPYMDSLYVATRIGRRLWSDSVMNQNIDSLEQVKELEYWKKQNSRTEWYAMPCFVCEDHAKQQLSWLKNAADYKNEFLPRLEKIRKLADAKQIDTITSTGYVLNYVYKGADFENKAITSDTQWLYVNKDYRVMKHEYYNDELYQNEY